MGSDVSVTIPEGALTGNIPIHVAVQNDASPPAAPSGFMFLGTVYQFTVGGENHYTFNSPVTLTFTFDPSKLAPGQTPEVYYYDDSKNQWVDIGGTVSGDTIAVAVDHYTDYAVMVQVSTQHAAPVLTDIAGNWAQASIQELVYMGAITGYPDGTFRPDNTITRAELISIIDKALKLPAYNPTMLGFRDVAPTDWFYDSVENAVYAGFVKGCGGVFKPNAPVTERGTGDHPGQRHGKPGRGYE